MSVVASVEDRVRELRAAGLGYKLIARETGIGATSVRRILIPGYAERLRKQSHEAKRRVRGVCESCGGPTRYNGTDGVRISRRCSTCGPEVGRQNSADARRGQGPLQLATLAFLSEPRTFTEIRDHLGITSNHMGMHLNRLLKQRLIRRVSRGVYVAVPPRTPAAETAEATSTTEGMRPSVA